MTDLQKFLTLLATIYPHPPMTPERAAAFELSLAGLPGDLGQHYLTLTRDPHRQFYPTPGEIWAVATPAPTTAVSNKLFADIEWAVLSERATLAVIAQQWGESARQATIACGGLDAIRTADLGQNRPFALKRFHEAMLQEHQTPTPAPPAALLSPSTPVGEFPGRPFTLKPGASK